MRHQSSGRGSISPVASETDDASTIFYSSDTRKCLDESGSHRIHIIARLLPNSEWTRRGIIPVACRQTCLKIRRADRWILRDQAFASRPPTSVWVWPVGSRSATRTIRPSGAPVAGQTIETVKRRERRLPTTTLAIICLNAREREMRSRIALSVVSAAIYVILVQIGVRQLWERDDYVQDAGRHGIAIDVSWWTPFPLGLAYGLNLPAVVVGHLGLATVIQPNSDRPSMVGELSVAPLVSVFWFWIVGPSIRLSELIRRDNSLRKTAGLTALCLSGILLSLFVWWGLVQHYSEAAPFHSMRDFQHDIESMNVMQRWFGLLWLAVGVFWLLMHSAALSRMRKLQ
jgi:hypothetical protein